MNVSYSFILLICLGVGVCAGATVLNGDESDDVKPFAPAGRLGLSQLDVIKLRQLVRQHVIATRGKIEVEKKQEIPVIQQSFGSSSWSQAVEDLRSVFNLEGFIQEVENLIANNSDFAEFLQKLVDIRSELEAVLSSDDFLKVDADLKELGIDVDPVIAIVTNLLDWLASIVQP